MSSIFFKKLENLQSALFLKAYKIFTIFLYIFFLLIGTFRLNSWAQTPIISSVDPSSGYNQEETAITINGNNFLNGVRMSLVGKPLLLSSIEGYDFNARDIFVAGNYAYVITLRKDLIILDISNKEHPAEVGSCNPSGSGRAVHVVGEYAYIACNYDGIRIIDISDKENPFEVGAFDPSGEIVARDIYVSGDYAFIASEVDINSLKGYGLIIIDVSDKKNPSKVGHFSPANANQALGKVVIDIYVMGEYAYITTNNRTFEIIDISNKEHPYRVSSYDIPGLTSSVYIGGNYAYITSNLLYPDYGGNLDIIDISDKVHPKKVSSYCPEYAGDVYALGDHIYIACGKDGLRVFNVTDKENPFEVAHYKRGVTAFSVEGDYIYICASNEGLQIVQLVLRQYSDISVLNSFTITHSISMGLVEGIYDLILTNPNGQSDILSNGFEVKQYHAPSIIRINGVEVVYGETITYSIAAGQTFVITPEANDIDPDDTIDFMFSGWMDDYFKSTNHDDIGPHSVTITATDSYDLSSSVTINVEVTPNPGIDSVDPDGGYNHEETDIAISGVNFTDGTTVDLILGPRLLNFIEYKSSKDLFLYGNYLYVLSGAAIKIIDVSNIMHPIEVCSYEPPGIPQEIYVQGNYAYIVIPSGSIFVGYGCCGPVYITNYRLIIVNVTNKKNPEVLGSYGSPVSGAALLSIRAVKGNYAYVSEKVSARGDDPPFPIPDYVPIKTVYQGVRIIDITDKEHPHAKGDFVPPSRADDIFVEGNYAYIATINDGLRIINISDKTDPYEVSFYDPQSLYSSGTISVYVADNYAYVAIAEGLKIVDISDKIQPQEIASFTDRSGPRAISLAPKCLQVLEDYAYIVCSNANNGLRIIDVSNKENPVGEGFYTSSFLFNGVYVKGDYIYLIDGEGLYIVQFTHKLCKNITVHNPQTITATVPSGLLNGSYDIVVTNPDGRNGVLHNAFTIYTDLFYRDQDNDGYGLTSDIHYSYSQEEQYTANQGGDCDDMDPNIYPGASEKCDGYDNDCNGQIDEGFSLHIYFIDADGDGYGDANSPIESCYQPIGYVVDNTDCIDNDNSIHPNGLDICDGKDNDCNGVIDDPNKLAYEYYYLDSDGDGYGDPNISQYACKKPPEYAKNPEDCDDTDKDVYLAAIEICDKKDNNCDGKVDVEGSQGCTIYYKDEDQDGQGVNMDSRCLCSPDDLNKYTSIYSGDSDDLDLNIQGIIL
ncbi:MAG: MopE-related protein, partial [bacterium]